MAAIEMNLVFRLNEIGFVLPICHLLEIREGAQEWLDPGGAESEVEVFGKLFLRGVTVPVFNLREKYGLPSAVDQEVTTVLVLGKPGKPWGITVDGVDGLFPRNEFVPHELPLLLRSSEQVYDTLDIWRGQPLIHCDPKKISAGWVEA